MKKHYPLPLSFYLAVVVLLTLILPVPSFALTFDDAFSLSLDGPEALAKTDMEALDYSYQIEFASRYTTTQKLTQSELTANGTYKSLSLNSSLNLLSRSLNARVSFPIPLSKPELPETVPQDNLVSLRGKVVNLFINILETTNNLLARTLASELSTNSYEEAKTDFERGLISFNNLNQAFDTKQNDLTQLERLSNTLEDHIDELCYLTNLEELPPLSYDYTVTFERKEDLPLTQREIDQLDYPILLAEYELAQAKSGLFPNMSVDASTNLTFDGNNSFFAGVSFRYVILGTNVNSKIEAAKGKLKTAEENREKNLRTLLKQKKRILSDYNNAVDSLNSAKKKLLETEEFLELARSAFNEGLISAKDLKKAELTYLQAENSFKAAHHSCFKLELVTRGLVAYQPATNPNIF
jgi:hypothetical protein